MIVCFMLVFVIGLCFRCLISMVVVLMKFGV